MSSTRVQESQQDTAVSDIQNAPETVDGQPSSPQTPSPHDYRARKFTKAVVQHLLAEVPEFRRLSELRQKGWDNPEGDRFFQQQRRAADHANRETMNHFYTMMQDIGNEMHRFTGAFRIKSSDPDEHSVLDMCMAPGGFLVVAMKHNPQARALGFSLPKDNGGHIVLLPRNPNITRKFLDITMLAADMGVTDIPTEHPDAANFLQSRQLDAAQMFDLIICDGQVLRTHERAAYREQREASRLTLTQLTLALEHIKPGGTMIVLLHKVEVAHTVQLLHTFDKFASVRLYKPTRAHAKRSSFYMLATNIRADSGEAAVAIGKWKAMWQVATFGTEDMYRDAISAATPDVEVILEEFGPRLVKLGRKIWDIQANALAKASFMKGNGRTW